MIINEDDYLAHYGTPRHSGRYPWGTSGWGEGDVDDDGLPRNPSILDYIKNMLGIGLSEKEIREGLGMSTAEYRAAKTIARNEKKQSDILMAQRLRDKGYSHKAIAERMGLSGESSVRALLAPGAKDKANILTATSNMLKEEVDSKKYVDVGAGVEAHLGVSKESLRASIAILQQQGYRVHPVKLRQVGTGQETQAKILVPPGVTQKEVWQNQSQIQQLSRVSQDNGRSFTKPEHSPIPVDPDRVDVRYKGEGGEEADGVIYVRPGVKDISLGKNRYAQVRVQVGDNHYLKGMALYKEDLPDGVDLLFNTSKPRTDNKFDAMKELTDDPLLPFGSVVRQIVENPGTPNEKNVSAMNLVNEEGQWIEWSRNISAQALSKQNPNLINKQLTRTYDARKAEYDEIMELTNPVVRKKLLEGFSDNVDAAAVHLKAAALERQNWQVILPVSTISETEIYAPNFRNGERVVLIRYPHGGTFEIPELTVNNRNSEAKKLLGDARDAVGINHTVAQRLSGADFDGDTVLVIPNERGEIKTSRALDELKDFDPISSFPAYEGMPRIKPDRKQQLMGDVSNLITDMTIKGATHSEIARAVKHSMVVIDSEKHNLNVKESARVNGIASLKEKYQGSKKAGASTLISRAGSPAFVPHRIPRPQSAGGPIDPVTGRKVYIETGRTTTTKTGQVVPKTIRSKKLAETDDAYTLSSGTRVESLYADHSNRLKNLANTARISIVNTPRIKYSPSAKKNYSKEVTSLNSKLALAERNRPLERQAQIIAKTVVDARRKANPDLDGDTLKKIRYQELEKARARVKAKKPNFLIDQNEWNAIQAGAITQTKLESILDNADMDNVRKLATPRPERLMTSAKTSRARRLLASGYTRAEVADQLGVSLSTLDAATVGEDWEED